MTDRDEGEREDRDRFLGGSRLSGQAALTVAVIVVVAAVVAVFASHRHSSAAGAGGVADGPAATETRSSPIQADAPLTAAPRGVVWRLVDGVALPYGEAGPRSDAGAVASGFAHTPVGALLACVQTAMRIGSVNPSAQAGEVRAMVVGPGQSALLASRPAAAPVVKPQVQGFQFQSYTASTAVIGLALRVTDVSDHSSQVVAAGVVTMRWSDGDWRMLLDTTPAPPPYALDPAMTGYVPFAGV